MAKRGYKLQEFAAHSSNVNCLRIGKKACRLLLTGGDDHNVNLWSIVKSSSLMSLCGHTSPVECVAFDSSEVLVLGGSSAGAVKLWDLEEEKMVRTLNGHRSSCSAVEFHPFGEFFASGYMDANLKIWDIRKKGCIHTYKGHTRGISTIRFTPDGRWVVSGGFDNVVKVWDLTAGKLLHDFNFHEGHIRSIDFHPLEFLLATGSADRTVKFWDLETFELIGSTRPEAAGVRAITFHPDGRTIFSGSDDGLKVYSWEPVICHDTVDMGWSTLGDICINDGKLFGCSSYQNSVGIWVADVSHIEPYGAAVPEQKDCTEKICNPLEKRTSEKLGSGLRSSSGLRCESPDYDVKEIKTIYVDSTGGNSISSQKIGSIISPKVEPLVSNEIIDLKKDLQSPAKAMQVKSNGQGLDKFSVFQSTAESPGSKDMSNSERESITFTKTKPGMLLRPAHVRKPSLSRIDAERPSATVESGNLNSMKAELDSSMDSNCQTQIISSDASRKSCEEKDSSIKTVAEKLEKILSPQRPPKPENSNESLKGSERTSPVKIINGVAVVRGRTRSLVERFERRETTNSTEDKASDNIIPDIKCASNEAPTTCITTPKNHNTTEAQAVNVTTKMKHDGDSDGATNVASQLDFNSVADQATSINPHTRSDCAPEKMTSVKPHIRSSSTVDETFTGTLHIGSASSTDQTTVVTRQMRSNRVEDQATNITRHMRSRSSVDLITDVDADLRSYRAEDRATTVAAQMRSPSSSDRELDKHNEDQTAPIYPDKRSASAVDQTSDITHPTRFKKSEDRASTIPPRTRLSTDQATSTPPVRLRKNEDRATTITPRSRYSSIAGRAADTSPPVRYKKSEDRASTITLTRSTGRTGQATETSSPVRHKRTGDRATTITRQMRFSSRAEANESVPLSRLKKNDNLSVTPQVTCEVDEQCTELKGEPLIFSRDAPSANDAETIENLMHTHDLFLSTLRSRLTKLQVVRHFWEKADVKGAISAVTKLPDHSVQADVISVLMEKMEILTLDVFACLLPLLVGLLDSTTERHVCISLEMLLKLVAVFGPVIRSTVSASPGVGVDLHAEQRRECCKQCFVQLQKIQNTLPELARRGGSLAKGALELNLVLQES